LCAFRRCRAPIPPTSGRGNRPRYCQDGKTWGPNELTCKAAEAALLSVDSLITADSALTPEVLEQLGQRFTEARDPLDRLLDAVTTVGRQVARRDPRGAGRPRPGPAGRGLRPRGARGR
jgi:hypothetical protein